MSFNMGSFQKYNKAAKTLHCKKPFQKRKKLTGPQWKIPKMPR